LNIIYNYKNDSLEICEIFTYSKLVALGLSPLTLVKPNLNKY